jgi:hypothetical protein
VALSPAQLVKPNLVTLHSKSCCPTCLSQSTASWRGLYLECAVLLVCALSNEDTRRYVIKAAARLLQTVISFM